MPTIHQQALFIAVSGWDRATWGRKGWPDVEHNSTEAPGDCCNLQSKPLARAPYSCAWLTTDWRGISLLLPLILLAAMSLYPLYPEMFTSCSDLVQTSSYALCTTMGQATSMHYVSELLRSKSISIGSDSGPSQSPISFSILFVLLLQLGGRRPPLFTSCCRRERTHHCDIDQRAVINLDVSHLISYSLVV